MKSAGVYLFGGIDITREAQSDMFRLKVVGYDRRDGYQRNVSWEKVEATGIKPLPRYNHCAAFQQPYLVIFSGRNDSEEMASRLSLIDQLCLFDVRVQMWTAVK
jgi:hypothetical protein